MEDRVVLPSKAFFLSLKALRFAYLPSSSCMLFEQMEHFCNMQYNDLVDQFVVVWLGIVAIMVDVNTIRPQRSWGQREVYFFHIFFQ